jgi:hypothetical protein
VVVVDPITDFVAHGTPHEVRSMMTRLVDHLKSRGITALPYRGPQGFLSGSARETKQQAEKQAGSKRNAL